MNTNLTIKRDSELYRKAEALLKAAHEYWQEYKTLGEPSAVVTVEAESGHFVLFTRSEYKQAIMGVVHRETFGEPPMEHPFEDEGSNR